MGLGGCSTDCQVLAFHGSNSCEPPCEVEEQISRASQRFELLRQVGHCTRWPGVAESTVTRSTWEPPEPTYPNLPEGALGISWQKAVGWGSWKSLISLAQGKGKSGPSVQLVLQAEECL